MADAPPPPGPGAALALPAPRSIGELFLVFTWISMQSFGGALAIIERTIVQRKRWLDAKEFVGLYALSQVLPGPTGISFCMLLGDRFFGARGAFAAVAGFMLVPSALILSVAALFLQFQHVPQVQGALHGMGAASVGLILSTAIRMASTLRGQRMGIGVALLSFAAVGLGRVPVSMVVLTLGAASVAWVWRSLPR